MGNVHVFNIGSIYSHGKGILRKFTLHQNTGNNPTMKKMFDKSEKLIVGQSGEIYGVTPINWEDSSWKQWSSVSDEEVISLSHAKVYVISDSVLCLEKMSQNPQSNSVWEDKLTWFKSSSQYRTFGHNWWRTDGIRVEYFPGFTTLQFCNKSKSSCQKWAVNQKNLKDESSSCRCSTTSHGGLKTMNRNANLTPTSFLSMREYFHQEDGHSSDLDQKRSGILLVIADHKENGTESLNWWWQNLESGHPIFRATSPLSRETLKSKGGGQLSIHFCADGGTIETVFRTIISVNQLSIYGAVSDLCEEYKACHVRTERLVLAGQSDPLIEPASLLTKTPTPSTNDLAQEDLLQKYQDRVEKLSRQNRVIKICIDADFWQQLESDSTSWQRTLKNSHNSLNQWHVVSTFCQEMKKHLTRKVGFEEHQNWARVRSHNQLLAR